MSSVKKNNKMLCNSAIHHICIYIFTTEVNLLYLFTHGTKNNFCVTPNLT